VFTAADGYAIRPVMVCAKSEDARPSATWLCTALHCSAVRLLCVGPRVIVLGTRARSPS
jgi:hypothetical protein